MDQRKNAVRVPGATISYAIDGEGIPCLVIGFGTYTARLLSRGLRRYFEFIVTDFRGLDASDNEVDIGAITLDTLLNDIEAVRKQVGHEHVAVMGLSICGTVALDYALAFPEHTSHVVLLCAPPCWTVAFKELQKSHMEEHLSERRRRLLERNRLSLAEEGGSIPRQVFERSSHHPMLEEQDLFDRALLEWIGRRA